MTEDIKDDIQDVPPEVAGIGPEPDPEPDLETGPSEVAPEIRPENRPEIRPETKSEIGPETEPDDIALLELLRRLRTHVRLEGTSVTLPRDVMADLLSRALGDLVDEGWYRDRYPDVGEAIDRGVLSSARVHYVQAGLYEGRMPYRVPLDNADYLASHPDVLASVREGAFRSALDHFVRVGFGEGRTFRLASREATDP